MKNVTDTTAEVEPTTETTTVRTITTTTTAEPSSTILPNRTLATYNNPEALVAVNHSDLLVKNNNEEEFEDSIENVETDIMNVEIPQKPLEFHTLVRHSVSAVITWSNEHWYEGSGHGHYKLTYFQSDEPEHKWSKKSRIPLFVIEDLKPQTIYTYQVVKVIKSRDETVWLRSGVIDTSSTS